MYRYGSKHEIVYTAQDLVLFKESPFASWMERLTLENPGHGIAPDCIEGPAASRWRGVNGADSAQRLQGAFSPLRWEDFVGGVDTPPAPPPGATLFTGPGGAEGDGMVRINPALDEAARREQTLRAMQQGARIIANAHLAVGQLSARVDLLLHSPGASDLGDYLYLPVDLGSAGGLHKAFCLAFAADLLHSLQGVLPPQLLVMRSDADMEAIDTDQHIHYLQSVRRRFMKTQMAFRKHRMPDPGESVHFGRWSTFASELMKRGASIDEARKLIDQPPAIDHDKVNEIADAVKALISQAPEGERGAAPTAANQGGAGLSSKLITNQEHVAL